MGSFFEKAKAMGAIAADKAGDAMELGKAKAKIVARKADVDKIYKAIGEAYYQNCRQESEKALELMEGYCTQIDEVNKEIQELESKIASM